MAGEKNSRERMSNEERMFRLLHGPLPSETGWAVYYARIGALVLGMMIVLDWFGIRHYVYGVIAFIGIVMACLIEWAARQDRKE